MRPKKEILKAVQTLRMMHRAAAGEPKKAKAIGSLVEVLYWATNHRKHGREFGKFIAQNTQVIDQARAEVRDAGSSTALGQAASSGDAASSDGTPGQRRPAAASTGL